MRVNLPGQLYLCRDGQLRTIQEIEERAAVQRERAKGLKINGMRPTLLILDEAQDDGRAPRPVMKT